MRKTSSVTKPRKTPPRDVLRKCLSEGGVWSFDATITPGTLDTMTRRGLLVWRRREHEGRVFLLYTLTTSGRSEAEGLPIPGTAQVDEPEANEADESDDEVASQD